MVENPRRNSLILGYEMVRSTKALVVLSNYACANAINDILYGPHTDLDILGSLTNCKIIIMINCHYYNSGTAILDPFEG